MTKINPKEAPRGYKAVKLPKKPAKPHKYVTRWVVAYEVNTWERVWVQRTFVRPSRAMARQHVREITGQVYYRNIMPPQAVKVRIA